jgi:hypothetical protein
MATKEIVEDRFDKIEANMIAMETRILEAFKQLIVTINTQRPPSE